MNDATKSLRQKSEFATFQVRSFFRIRERYAKASDVADGRWIADPRCIRGVIGAPYAPAVARQMFGVWEPS